MNEAPTEDQHTRLRLAAIATLAALAMVALALFMRRADAPTPASDPGDTARPMAVGPAGLAGALHDDATAPVDSVPTESATADPAADPHTSAPLPPPGTRLYASVAELLADPPAAGETVWLDAYHGEVVEAQATAWDIDRGSGCPSMFDPVLIDAPALVHLAVFDEISSFVSGGYVRGSSIMAAGLSDDGHVTPNPNLPRYGRLVVHLGDPALDHCREPQSIALVERIEHVFAAKPDWTAIHEAIRTAKTVGWIEGSMNMSATDAEPDEALGAFTIAIPDGLELGGLTTLRPEITGGDLLARLSQANLPDHPILIRRYAPSRPGYAAMQQGLAESGRWHHRHEQEPSGPPKEALGRTNPLTFAVTDSAVAQMTSSMSLGYRPRKIRALTDVSGVLYEFEVALPEDNIEAQPLLWRFEALLDRFMRPAVGDAPRIAVSSSGLKALEPAGSATLGNRVLAGAVADSLTLFGGTMGLGAVSNDRGRENSSYDPTHLPPSPDALGIASDTDVEGSTWAVHALAIRAPYGYAALEWPEGSGRSWLYVLDLLERSEAPPDLVPMAQAHVATIGAIRLDPGTDAPFGHVRSYAMALAGDRLLVGTSAGLFDVDVSNPTKPVVRAPLSGLQGVISAVAVAPDGRRAWACGGQLNAGSVTALDLAEPSAMRIAGTHASADALLDCATDGATLWATTGSETHDVMRFDVSGSGEPRLEGAFRPEGGVAHAVAVLGKRLVLGATDIDALATSSNASTEGAPASGGHGLMVYDVSRPDAPIGIELIRMSGPVYDLATDARFLLVAAGEHGVFEYGPVEDE